MILFLLFVAFPILLTIVLFPKAIKTGNNNPPPGPIGLPFIGSLLQFDSVTPHLYFTKLSKKYGEIFSLKLGSIPIVVVSSAKLAKEVLKTQDLVFCSRPSILGQRKLSYNNREIIFAPYNDYWREMRKISVLHLFSLKKVQAFRPVREDEVARMIKKVSEQAASSQLTNLSNLMITLTSTNICRIAFGIRFDDEAQERKRFIHLLTEAQAMMASFFVTDLFPSLSWIDKLSGLTNRLERLCKELDEMYDELIEQHESPNRPKSMEGDIVDLLLQLKKEKSTAIHLTLEDIKGVLMDLFVAGSDTTAATLTWAMTALIKNPNVMKKAQEEIRNLIGSKGIVNEDDIQNMPYFKLLVKEVFRLYLPSPLIVQRESMKKTTIEGYEIEAGTTVYVNAWLIGRDPEIWGDPEAFRPERFLNSSMSYKGQDFELLPFGAGRRICPGMELGVATLELALSNLLYSFDWELPYGLKREDIDMDVRPGLTPHKKNPLCLIAKKYLFT